MLVLSYVGLYMCHAFCVQDLRIQWTPPPPPPWASLTSCVVAAPLTIMQDIMEQPPSSRWAHHGQIPHSFLYLRHVLSPLFFFFFGPVISPRIISTSVLSQIRPHKVFLFKGIVKALMNGGGGAGSVTLPPPCHQVNYLCHLTPGDSQVMDPSHLLFDGLSPQVRFWGKVYPAGEKFSY